MACRRDQRLHRVLVSIVLQRLFPQVLTVLLEVVLSWGGELDGSKLVTVSHVNKAQIFFARRHLPTSLESADDWANESTLKSTLISIPASSPLYVE